MRQYRRVEGDIGFRPDGSLGMGSCQIVRSAGKIDGGFLCPSPETGQVNPFQPYNTP